MYYLETAVSLAQPFLHGANMPQYSFPHLYEVVMVKKITPTRVRKDTSARFLFGNSFDNAFRETLYCPM
jgi:hypothetical protein